MRKLTPIESKFAYFKNQTWWRMNRRSINGLGKPTTKAEIRYRERGITISFTRQEFFEWCDENKSKITSLYSSGKTPSIDRKDSTKGYCLSNVRILELRKNVLLGAFNSGKVIKEKYGKKIVGTHKENHSKISFSSLHEAERNGFDRKSLGRCLSGRFSHHKGYIWEII
jgi:hypothetical protein